jgi:hypothetical protein
MTDLIDAGPAARDNTTDPIRLPSPQLPRVIQPDGALPSPSGRSRQAWARRLQPLARPCGYYFVSRIGVFFAALVARWMFPKFQVFASLGSMWDGAWYLKIAAHGYPSHLFQEGDGSRWAFFPAWPAFIRGTSAITGMHPADAAVVLAFVFGLTSVVTIWLAVRKVFGRTVADRSILLYVFFPTAYVLSMGYTEGLFLTVAGGCLYALAKRYWVTAALFAVVAGLTRNLGVVVILCVVVAAVPVIRRERPLRPTLAILIAPLGLVSFMAYAWLRVGTPLAFLTAQKYWDNAHFISFTAPLYSLRDLLTSGSRALTHGSTITAVSALLFAYVGVVLFARMRRSGLQIPPYWWVFTIGAVLTAFSPYYPNSILRYTMAAFPLFVAYAWRIKPAWEGAIAATMAMTQGAMTIIVLVAVVHPMTPFFP